MGLGLDFIGFFVGTGLAILPSIGSNWAADNLEVSDA